MLFLRWIFLFALQNDLQICGLYSSVVDCILQEALYIFTNPSARARYDTKSIFKRSLTGLNLEFSFS